MNWTLGTKPRKYRNQPTEYAGRVYASKAQAEHAAQLDLEKRSGQIVGWIPEVSIPLPPPYQEGERMRLDFFVIMPQCKFRFQDVKGMKPTEAWNLKRKACENAYGITIDIIHRTRR
jgi:hypothetical protein